MSTFLMNGKFGNYGSSLMEVFKNLAQDVGICLANTEVVTNNAEDWKFDEIVISILQTKSVKVVACFCEGMTVRGILKAIRRLNATGEFLLVGSSFGEICTKLNSDYFDKHNYAHFFDLFFLFKNDGWSDRYDVVEGYEVEASGGISVRIHSPYVNEFDPYYFNLHPDNNTRNPWFKEFWEFKFNCSLTPKVVKDQAQAKTPLLPNQAPFPGTRLFNRSCSGNYQTKNQLSVE
uniref:Receptor ligand binding region domain-containing protein n=1 Tax=Tetranychus urticae TaxID=32264 RepID=T1KRK7_TETUR